MYKISCFLLEIFCVLFVIIEKNLDDLMKVIICCKICNFIICKILFCIFGVIYLFVLCCSYFWSWGLCLVFSMRSWLKFEFFLFLLFWRVIFCWVRNFKMFVILSKFFLLDFFLILCVFERYFLIFLIFFFIVNFFFIVFLW